LVEVGNRIRPHHCNLVRRRVIVRILVPNLEELIAELGAAFLCAEFGFDGDVRNAG
jgi:hypothetical protein